MFGPHATNLEMGIPEGRSASHGGAGNSHVAKEREGHETFGGVNDCGKTPRTSQQPGRSATSRRESSTPNATSQSERKADGERKSEGPI